MPHLQDVRAELDAFCKKPPFRLAARIAREEHPKAPVLQHERDGVAVDRVGPADEGQRRADELQRDAVVGVPVCRGARIQNRDAFRARRFHRVAVRVPPVALAAVGQLDNAKPPQHGRDAADVIAVRVRDDDGVDGVNSLAQEKRHDGALADAFGDGAVDLWPALEAAARVDQEHVTARRLDDDRVGLADVEHGDAQPRVDAARRPQHECRRRDERPDDERLRASPPEH